MVAQPLSYSDTQNKPFVLGILFLTFVTWLVNASIMASITIIGVHPDLASLPTFLVASFFEPELATIIGFFSGLLFDLSLTTPFGLSSLCLTIFGYLWAVGVKKTSYLSRVTLGLLSGVSAVFFQIIYASISQLAGQPHMVSFRLVAIALVAFVSNFFIVIIFARFLGACLLGKNNNPFKKKKTTRKK